MKLNQKIILTIITTFVASAPFSYGQHSDQYDIDAGKSHEKFKHKTSRGTVVRTEMQFKVYVHKQDIQATEEGLIAELFVFATNPVTDRDLIHFKQTFPNIKVMDRNQISAVSKKFNLTDKSGDYMSDRLYKGFYLRLKNRDGKIVAVRTTHPHFFEIIQQPKPSENETPRSNEVKNKEPITWDRLGNNSVFVPFKPEVGVHPDPKATLCYHAVPDKFKSYGVEQIDYKSKAPLVFDVHETKTVYVVAEQTTGIELVQEGWTIIDYASVAVPKTMKAYRKIPILQKEFEQGSYSISYKQSKFGCRLLIK